MRSSIKIPFRIFWKEGDEALTLILPMKYLLNVSSAIIFNVIQDHSKLVKILSECQSAWIRIRRFGVSFGSKLFANSTLVEIGRLRVKIQERRN